MYHLHGYDVGHLGLGRRQTDRQTDDIVMPLADTIVSNTIG